MKMRLPSFAYPENLKIPEEPQAEPPLPQDVRALELLQRAYRGEIKPTAVQMRAAIEALPFENPKLSAVGVGYLENNTFADRLDRAVEASNRAKMIEGKVIEHGDGEQSDAL
jgi:hypothetical protein